MRTVLSTLLLAAGCAGARRVVYEPGDPLSGAREPETVYAAGPSTGTALFSAVLPRGYARAEAALSAPVAAMFRHDTAFGEAAVVVERYGERWGAPVSREDFAARLSDGRVPEPSKHGALTAYHGVDFVVTERRIGPDDPWRDALGSSFGPPRLSPAEGRRFLAGGEAYRLYRCERLDAWGVLGDYRRAQDGGKVEAFRESHTPQERRLVSACFGSWVAHAVAEGRPVPPIPKPSMGSLRGMAREEWARNAVTRRERECVVLVDAEGGFWALRLRSPLQAFADEHAGFLEFASSFRP